MLNCESYIRKRMAIRCLEVLCLAKVDYWKCILQAGETLREPFVTFSARSYFNNNKHSERDQTGFSVF